MLIYRSRRAGFATRFVAALVLILSVDSCRPMPPDGGHGAPPPVPDYGAPEDPIPQPQPTPEAINESACADNLSSTIDSKKGGYYRPDLMAIGDSLFNGMQSMRVNLWMAEWSVPAIVAIRMGLIEERGGDRLGGRTFYVPQYQDELPKPTKIVDYGFSLENLPGTLELGKTLDHQADLLSDLMTTKRPRNNRVWIDNIAFAGATSFDLLHWTARDHRATAAKWLQKMRERRTAIDGFGKLSNAFTHANAAFVLDPQHRPCTERLTPIEQVERRHPKVLLISVGANDGMWRLAFNADVITADACDADTAADRASNGKPECVQRPIERALEENYLDNMRELVGRLAKISDLEAVFIDNLPRPSQTANLVPDKAGNSVSWHSNFTGKKIASDQVRQSDELIDHVNNELQKNAEDVNKQLNKDGKLTKFHVVDLAKILGHYDYKGCRIDFLKSECEDKIFKANLGAPIRFTNEPTQFSGEAGVVFGELYEQKANKGGLFSQDNMHLSSVGYEIVADAIIKNMKSDPGVHLLDVTLINGHDACPAKGVKNNGVKIGWCAADMTTPGWGYSDASRRANEPLRYAGRDMTERSEALKALLRFATIFFG